MTEIKPTVAERISDLLTSSKLSDTEFIFQNGDTVKGHKLIFAIASPIFEAMFYGGLAKHENEIMIVDIDPKGFKTMVEFIYSNVLQLESVSHALSVYKAADKYDLPFLQKKTLKYIESNIQEESALEIFEFSKLHNVHSAKEKCIRLLREKTIAVLSSNYASKCSIDILQTIVDEEKLEIPEVELFRLVENWAKCYMENNGVPLHTVKPLLKNIISKIRFLTMSVTDFLSSPFISDLLSFEEKHHLVLNLNQPNSAPLPANFSNSTTFREPSKKFTLSFTCASLNWNRRLIQWRLKNLLEIKFGKNYFSPTFYLADNPFKVVLGTSVATLGRNFGVFYIMNESRKRARDLQWFSSLEFAFKLYINERAHTITSTPCRPFHNRVLVDCRHSPMGYCTWSIISDKITSNDDYILIEVDLKKINDFYPA